jgi:hypothetical protein
MIKITQEEKEQMLAKGFEPYYLDDNTVSWKRIGKESKRKPKEDILEKDEMVHNMHIVENTTNVFSDYE